MQQVKAGIKAIYLSGWQVAADNNSTLSMYPDQSLYPVDSVPTVVERINNSFKRADEIQWSRGIGPGDAGYIDYFAPIVADAEAGFGGVLNAFELMKAMIKAGAGGVHFEDQLASVKKCGHMGGKVLVPTQEAVQKLTAARLAADVMGVPTLILARTDAEAADLLTSDVDDNDKPFITGARTAEGFYKTYAGLDQAISRGLAYAPYADMVWCETGKPDLEFARKFAEAIHHKYPGKILAYNCSPSFNWKKNLDDAQGSSANWAPWATNTSSSRSPASIRCGSTCSTWRTTMRAAACRPTSRKCRNRNSSPASAATALRPINKRSVPATSMTSPRSSKGAARRSPHSPALPKPSSSSNAAKPRSAEAHEASSIAVPSQPHQPQRSQGETP
jgi:isocitrate lyase